ncbi:MAG TPA: LysM peptidoglycan-binding domain-containing protein [Pirellulales bacterium]|nr:LysM peptidoglycan-binding domain-containing protein [Pirellulales bacterium]
MESLKPMLLCIVLGGVGYGVYVALNHVPPPEASPVDSPWNKPTGMDAGAPREPDANSAGSVGNSTGGGMASGMSTTANPWQGQISSGVSAINAAPAANGNSPAPGIGNNPMASAVSNLPFGIGSSGGQTAAAAHSSSAPPPLVDIPQQAGAPSAAESLPAAGTAQPSAVLSPSEGSPPTAAQPPASGMPAGGMPAATSNFTAPNQTQANPATDAQARHDYDASKRTVLTYLNRGQLVEALRELSRWYDQPIVPPEDQPHLVELLGQLAGTVIYSRDAWLTPPYEVRVGDSLESIAQQYQVPWQLLAKINGLQNADSVMPGQKLKVVPGPFRAQLNVQQGWLTLFVDGLYAGRYRVQVNGPLAKPDGDYPVVKFAAGQMGASPSGAPFISLGGDLHLRVPDDALPPGVNAVRISRQDMSDVFDILSDRSQVTIHR